jgi:predicted ferric reductase
VQLLRSEVQILHMASWRLGREHLKLNRQCISTVWALMCNHQGKGTIKMLWTICVILVVLWALGMATAYTASGLIHILLVLAVIVMLIRLLQGRRVV